MDNEIRRSIVMLTGPLRREDIGSEDALRFSQAVLNLMNALACMKREQIKDVPL